MYSKSRLESLETYKPESRPKREQTSPRGCESDRSENPILPDIIPYHSVNASIYKLNEKEQHSCMPHACHFSLSACATSLFLYALSDRLEQNVQTTTACQRTHDTRTDTSRRATTTLLHISLRRRVSLLLVIHWLATLRRISLRRVASLLRRVSLLRRHEATVVWVGSRR